MLPVMPRTMRAACSGSLPAISVVPRVHVVDEAKPREREVRVHGVEDRGLARQELRPAAGGDDASVPAELFLESCHHALDEADVAIEGAGLDGAHGVLAYCSLRPLQLDAVELGGVLEQSLGRDADAGRDGAAQVVALGGHGIE